MILTVAAIKGGVGKSTIAVNLAAWYGLREGREVLLIDTDPQGTIAHATSLHDRSVAERGYTSVQLTGTAVLSQVRALAPKFDLVIIDAGGRDNPSLRAAMTVSHVLLSPVQPRDADLWAFENLEPVVDLARNAAGNLGLRVASVLSLADPSGPDNAIASGYLETLAWADHLNAPIVRRKAYSNALGRGLSVLEHRPRDRKAVAEIETLATTLNVYTADMQRAATEAAA